MALIGYNELPPQFDTKAVRPYFEAVKKRVAARFFKRFFDIIAALVLTVFLLPLMLLLAVAIRCESKGPAIYKSRRITRYGRPFNMYKFRTMKWGDKGSTLTLPDDCRITGIGKFLRPLRLDELPQLFNLLMGDMSFVGPRPEDEKFVKLYTGEMLASLLMPAGITSPASIKFKNEDKILKKYIREGYTPDEAYIKHILPEKIRLNLGYIKNFGFFSDILICLKTLF